MTELVNELSERISKSRNQIQEYNSYEPQHVSTWYYQGESGMSSGSTSHNIPPRLLRKWVVKTGRNDNYAYLVGGILVVLGFGGLNGSGKFVLSHKNKKYEETLKNQQSGSDLHSIENRVIRKSPMKYGG